MNLLLDSHALLWALHDPTKMRPGAVEAIRDRDLVCYSCGFGVGARVKGFAREAVAARRLARCRRRGRLSPSAHHRPRGAGQRRLPWHHADPFDRVLVAQAKEHGFTIATDDPDIPA